MPYARDDLSRKVTLTPEFHKQALFQVLELIEKTAYSDRIMTHVQREEKNCFGMRKTWKT